MSAPSPTIDENSRPVWIQYGSRIYLHLLQAFRSIIGIFETAHVKNGLYECVLVHEETALSIGHEKSSKYLR